MPDLVDVGSEDAPMPDISAVGDTSEAQWFVAGLDPSWKTVGGLVPRGFEAYARILHPAWRVRREGDGLVRSPVRWSEVYLAELQIEQVIKVDLVPWYTGDNIRLVMHQAPLTPFLDHESWQHQVIGRSAI